MKIRLSNIPVPEHFVIALAAGLVLHILTPSRLLSSSTALFLTGATLIILGLAIAAWSVIAASDNDMAHPRVLITRGPYAFSRNPMYLGWTSLSVGITFAVNSLWMASAVAAAWPYLNFVSIPREEASLQRTFGPEYEAYRHRVRRWL